MIYKNGNTIVEIQKDGTKIRYVPDNVPAQPVYPESIDMKICNRCEMGCPMCHEQSSPTGKLGDLSSKLIDSLHPYTEVAIGGGDPFSHPKLLDFLKKLKKKKVIANITVHWKHFAENYEFLHALEKSKLIYGIGISVNEVIPSEVVDRIAEFPNAVVHVVIGVSGKDVIHQLENKNLNILLLGYKDCGRGVLYKKKHSHEIISNTIWTSNHIPDFADNFKAVSFDNLAIEQTHLKTKITKEAFQQMYMGDDGTFTMYIDLVENKYAVSSTSIRKDIFSNNIDELFKSIKE